ncbi:hypothetical protein GWI33_009196 [Rhynchophorus ferrugineus]|uniref:TBC domain-containing protein kinase-like protein n=1 Tax=Rhynchophorus ferrugineus TaxID=354439 RepID=A0A834IB44_RHYFE|nr:hypothetical protein GWI33_009196 [Rhynchophorus ferrugineus]
MTVDMPVSLLKNPELKFGAITFFAKQHKGDTCGSNGLPLTPNSIIIVGNAQLLKTIKSPFLCDFLDIIRGKHERTIVVSQYCGTPLAKIIDKHVLTHLQIKKIAYQALKGLSVLHKLDIVHRNLSNENILRQENGDIKLFNYGLYHMTNRGALVSFPVLEVLYTAPEVYLSGFDSGHVDKKVDIWSLGQRIRKILSLLQVNTSIFEKIAREHNCYEVYLNLPADLKELIELCLNIYPSKRLSCEELLDKLYFNEFRDIQEQKKMWEPFEVFSIQELYYWWQLAGGDVFQELKKQGLIRSSPPILSLPSLVLIEGTLLGQDRNPATLYDPRIVEMPLETLYQRFIHIPITAFYPLIHSKSDIISSSDPPPYDATGLPLVIKEKDPEYQFHRVILFRRLLHGYPFTKDLIRQEAEKDIPPLLRGDVWSALLNVPQGYERDYMRLDKYSHTTTDRQIEVDIPRCHQYNELLSSTQGHKKLKRILKAWVYKNSQYVYWQGLDSLTAPFLYLNFNDEAKAFACLSNFIPRYLHKFFLKDNTVVIEEYLAKFSQLISFHDPQLANHLHDINFDPKLFAIPWILTLFSHVFPLYKILHLWDKLLLCDASFPLHIGLSILTQLRDRLLTSGFNECILLFSDLPEVDIEKCVIASMQTYQSTPRSITSREHENEQFYKKNDLDIRGVTLEELKKESCPRISAADIINTVRKNPDKILLIDIRNTTLFHRSCVKGSVNIPFSSVSFNETVLDNLGTHSSLIKSKGDKVVAIIGDCETDLERFPNFLLQCNVSRVCVLHGDFNRFTSVIPTILTSGTTN